jgi:FlaA1/EpsC-like NDP-sugar epimerase
MYTWIKDMNIFSLLGRSEALFGQDLIDHESQLTEIINRSRFLIIGGGGSIGQAVCKQLFQRRAGAIHVVDLSENYLAELVRDLRSSFGYSTSEFDTFAIDCGAPSFQNFIRVGNYDYILNLSAMKHVRSENSSYSLERMVQTNIVNVFKTFVTAAEVGVKKYFCVSTDKAANPANYMGATKRAMELCLMHLGATLPVSGARFANVAFSHGSLLESFVKRLEKGQPLSMPNDIQRFFISTDEAGIICMFSALLGKANQIYFPYNDQEVKQTYFKEIAYNYLQSMGKKPIDCFDEQEARDLIQKVDLQEFWPVNLFNSDTAGEKPFEEFYTKEEDLFLGDFHDLAFVQFHAEKTLQEVTAFINEISAIDPSCSTARELYFSIMNDFVPTFQYVESERFLNSRM